MISENPHILSLYQIWGGIFTWKNVTNVSNVQLNSADTTTAQKITAHWTPFRWAHMKWTLQKISVQTVCPLQWNKDEWKRADTSEKGVSAFFYDIKNDIIIN